MKRIPESTKVKDTTSESPAVCSILERLQTMKRQTAVLYCLLIIWLHFCNDTFRSNDNQCRGVGMGDGCREKGSERNSVRNNRRVARGCTGRHGIINLISVQNTSHLVVASFNLAALKRLIFFPPMLSSNGTFSCCCSLSSVKPPSR